MTMGAARFAASAVAAVAWTGLVLLLSATLDRLGSLPASLWANAAYYTDISNLLVALVFSAIAMIGAARISPRTYGFALVAMLLMTAVYWTILGGADAFGTAGLGDTIAHGVVPALTLLYWLVFVPKGALVWRDSLLWPAFPLAYFGYGVERGAATGEHPYFFMDAGRLGYAGVFAYGAGIAVFCVIIGLLVVAADRALGARRA